MWSLLVYLLLIPPVAVTLILVFYIIRGYRFWKIRGVPDYPQSSFWSSFLRTLFVTKSLGDLDFAIYKHFKGKKYGGFVEFVNPVLFVFDPELMRNICVKDFDHFVDRINFDFGKKAEYINLMVSNLTGQKWKDVRSVMTPTFTSGKMKRVFQSVCGCGDQLIQYFNEKAENDEEIEMKDAFGRFTMDVIASTAFGVKCNSLKDPDAIFPKMANKMMNPPPHLFIVGIVTIMFPRFIKFLRMVLPIPGNLEPLEFFASVVKEAVAEREKNGVKGKDFLQLLLDAKQGDLAEDAESDKFLGYNANSDQKAVEERKELSKAVLSEPLIIAQSIIFFIAGFETTANTLSFVAYELALNPDIQEKLFEEVKDVLEKHDGVLNYDSIIEMEYMEKIIQEALRIHSPAPRLMRTCTKDYQIPDTDVTIEKGTMVMFPSLAIHRDEKFFPNPTKFDPERFSSEEKAKRHPYVYQPFGHGPRNCLGMRFAMMEAKVSLAMTVLNFRFQPSQRTDIPMKYALAANLTRAKNGVWLKLEKRSK